MPRINRFEAGDCRLAAHHDCPLPAGDDAHPSISRNAVVQAEYGSDMLDYFSVLYPPIMILFTTRNGPSLSNCSYQPSLPSAVIHGKTSTPAEMVCSNLAQVSDPSVEPYRREESQRRVAGAE
jgi:hypothetical protein